jgi:putative pyruvate formate lyase activating enzyme
MLRLQEEGTSNINLVTPTQYALQLVPILREIRGELRIPVVYNCGGYESVETLRALEGLIDVYLPDCKYYSPQLSASYSAAPDYFSVSTDALREMLRQTGAPEMGENGLMKRGVLVRHLVLPGHTRASMAVLEWLRQNLPKGAYISILLQYTPFGDLPSPLDRPLTLRECRKIRDFAEEIGITDGYIQQHNSSGAQYVPLFDLTGV